MEYHYSHETIVIIIKKQRLIDHNNHQQTAVVLIDCEETQNWEYRPSETEKKLRCFTTYNYNQKLKYAKNIKSLNTQRKTKVQLQLWEICSAEPNFHVP